MDVRRFHSTNLAEVGTEDSYGSCVPVTSPHGSPKAQSHRLPALWKSLKSKLGSLSTSRSATNLSSLAMAAPEARAPPSISPPAQSVLRCTERSTHTKCRPPQCLLLSGSSLERGLGRQDTASLGAFVQQTGAKDVSGVASPRGVCTSLNALSTGPSSTSSSAASNVTTKPINIAEPQLPSAPRVDSSHLAQSRVPQAAAEAAPTANRKLLAVSPALPSSMRRSVWALEDYSIARRIFKGSSSAVYRATCRRSGLPVALKVYFLSRVPANVVHMLKREIEIHVQLVHRHVARLYAAFMDEGDRVVLVQEYAAHGDLYGILQRFGGRMPPEQVADGVMRPFMEALSYLHSRGVCHRDVKPENILLTQSWRLLVADFGVSIDLSQERAVTRAGTEGYMAPEVERCPLKQEPHDNKDDPRYAYSTAVDIWAAGALAYELLVGFPPVVKLSPGTASASSADQSSVQGSDSVSGFVRSHMTPASLHFPASVPPAARAFVIAALAPDPLERPTAAQLLRHPWLQLKAVVPTAAAAAEPSLEAISSSVGKSIGTSPDDLCVRNMAGLGVSKGPGTVVSASVGSWPVGSSGSEAKSALCIPA